MRTDTSNTIQTLQKRFLLLQKTAINLVFNDSRVLDARLYLQGKYGSKVESMILDLGSIDVRGKCIETSLHAMIRSEVQAGDIFKEFGGNNDIKVLKVKEVWEEDEKSDGNGTECFLSGSTVAFQSE